MREEPWVCMALSAVINYLILHLSSPYALISKVFRQVLAGRLTLCNLVTRSWSHGWIYRHILTLFSQWS